MFCNREKNIQDSKSTIKSNLVDYLLKCPHISSSVVYIMNTSIEYLWRLCYNIILYASISNMRLLGQSKLYRFPVYRRRIFVSVFVYLFIFLTRYKRLYIYFRIACSYQILTGRYTKIVV